MKEMLKKNLWNCPEFDFHQKNNNFAKGVVIKMGTAPQMFLKPYYIF